MAALLICITGEPVLHRVATPVLQFDDTLRELVSSMFATMEAAPGVGLAAPQVGVDARVFLYDYTDDDDVQMRGVAINPELLIAPLTLRDANDDDDLEGCLSVPGERFALRRSDRALLRATDLDGKQFEINAHGWLARIFQHEYDHLEGVLYVDRLAHPLDRAAAKAIRKRSWGSAGNSWLPGRDHLDD